MGIIICNQAARYVIFDDLIASLPTEASVHAKLESPTRFRLVLIS